MGGGSPDYTKTTKIMANFGGALVPVAVDASGQLYALLKGFDGATYVPISVDADGRLVAVMTGSDGVDARVLLTDADGRLISVIQDPVSGFNVGVDSDGFMTTIIKGADGANLRTLKVDGSGRLVGTIVDATTGDSASVDTEGNLTTVMKGIEGANLRTIAVDVNGNIVGVFKGTYGATLKTLSVDSNGRIEAVITDPLNVLGETVTIGNTELAARLWSPDRWLRGGMVVDMESFDRGIADCRQATAGTGAEIILSADHARTGGYSCKMTTGDTVNDETSIRQGFAIPNYEGRIGLEYHWTTLELGNDLVVYLNMYDGTTLHRSGIKLGLWNGFIFYLNNANAWINTGVTFGSGAYQEGFAAAKMIVDLDTDKYVSFVLQSRVIDIAGISFYTTGSGDPRLAQWKVTAKLADGVASKSLWVDDIILTTNEA